MLAGGSHHYRKMSNTTGMAKTWRCPFVLLQVTGTADKQQHSGSKRVAACERTAE